MFYISICIPMFVWVIGLLLAIVRWKKSPRKSMLVLIGLSIMLFGGLADIIQYYASVNLSYSPVILSVLRIFPILGIFFDLIGWILCIIAIFIEDKKENEVK
jgi:disulfide bond formation protein DsbB